GLRLDAFAVAQDFCEISSSAPVCCNFCMPGPIYLHEVLDVWFEEEVKPRLRGRAFLVRYADDAVMVFSEEEDARRVQDVLPKRFGRYGLTLHPEKTGLPARLVEA